MSAVEAMGRISQIQSSIRSLTQPTAQQVMGVAVLGSGTATSAAGASLATTSTTSAVQALTGASASTGNSQDFTTQLAALSGAAAVAPAPASATGPTGADLVAEARKYVGVPYVWGGATPQGLDCSGLVKLSLSALGVDMPRVAREQMTQGTPVASLDQAEPGDLLVFDGGSHIGIYLGEGRMIDAPKPGDRVRERDVYETPTAIRRVLPTASEAAAAAAAAAPALSTAAQVEQLLASSAADRSSMTALLGDAA
jgi:cell wall-associated NlpC family hydrolase